MAKIFKASRHKKAKPTPSLSTTTVKIDANDHHGSGLSLTSQPVIVVEDAIAGETCKVKINKQTKRVQFAQTVEVLEPSDKRSVPFCRFYKQCGGCTLQHLSAKDGLSLKENAFRSYLSKQLGLNLHENEIFEAAILSMIDYQNAQQTPLKPNTDYRRRIRLAIDARQPKHIKMGFRSRASNDVVDIDMCAIASRNINAGLKTLRSALPSMPNIKGLGHIVITEGLKTVEIAFFVTQAWSCKHHNWFLALAQAAQVNINVIKANQSLFRVNSAGKTSTDVLQIQDSDNLVLYIDSNQFLQVNQSVNQKMLKQTLSWLKVTKEDILYDFYCGAGNFSLFMAEHVKSVYAFEGLETLVDAAKTNADSLSIENCNFTKVDISQNESLQTIDIPEGALLILDPSREGALQLCEHLLSKKVKRLVYVSCNPNSFTRDAKVLSEQYTLDKISMLDMFPYTKHVEVMALFSAN